MSNGPTLVGETAMEATKENWCNMKITKEMYCGYSGDCPLNRVIQDKEICLWCAYRVGVSMPTLIKERLKDGKI